jgi:hypothetical protein
MAATRTWKNVSSWELKIARNLTRSSRGTDGSWARSRMRALRSSSERSRLR